MSLDPMNYRYVGSAAFGTANCPTVQDVIYTLGLSATYADTSSRTPGSGSAWTWSRYQNVGVTESVRAVPPVNTLGQAIIIGGATLAPGGTFTLLAPDVTPAGNQLHVGIAKNAGSFATWNSTAPFTTGQFSNYWRIWPTTAGTGNVYMWEGTEGLVIMIGSGVSFYGFIIGGIGDPIGGDTVNDSETDGKVYGMITSGITAVIPATFWSVPASVWMFHSVSSSGSHAGFFVPGTATIATATSGMSCPVATTATHMRSKSGRFARAPIFMRANAVAPNDVFLCKLRNIMMFSRAQTPESIPGVGYVVSGAASALQDSLFLEHA